MTQSEMTIDELGQRTGLAVSTIRMYQAKRVLDPPEKRGRVGYYGPDHVKRLQLIADLQERGFSLAAIREAVDSWATGRSLSSLLGAEELVAKPEEPVRVAASEIFARFGGVALDQSDLQRAGELGLLRVDGADVVVESPSFLEAGPAIAQLGVPISVILDRYEELQAAIGTVTSGFGEVFEQYAFQPFLDSGAPLEDVAGLTEAVQKLTRLARMVVGVELERQLGQMATRYMTQVDPSA